MTVRLTNGETGRIRAVYEYSPVLAPNERHRRALLVMQGGTDRDVRADEIGERVSFRPRLAVVAGGRR